MNNKQCKFDYNIIFFLLLPLLIFELGNITVIFYNNDDFYLNQIASGEFTGTPQAHLLHIGYITGLLLKGLYTVLPAIPWYGLLLFIYGYVSIMLSVYSVTKQIEKTAFRIATSLFFAFISIPFLWIHIIELQYTTITAVVCAASLVHFYIAKEEPKPSIFLVKTLPSIIMFLLAVEIRDKACFMFLPTFFLVGVIKWFKNHKLLKSILAYGGVLLCLCILAFGINKIAYSSEEWNSFRTYNTARENIVDYNGYPDYETHRKEYEELGITPASYESATTRYQLLLDENINTNFMVQMEEMSHHFKPDIKQMVSTFLNRHISDYSDRPLNLIVYVLYFFTLLLIVCTKCWKSLLDVGALFAGRMIVWLYLLYIGRPMPRVTQGVYVMEFLMLLAILCSNNLLQARGKKTKNEDSKEKPAELKPIQKHFHRIIILLFVAASIFSCIKWGIPNFITIREHSISRNNFSVAYDELQNYFYENGENLYLLDTNSFSYFTEDVFTQNEASRANTILLGSWTANSPWTDSVARRFQITSYEEAAVSRDDIYFVFMNTEGTGYEYLERYFQSKYPNSHIKIHDTLLTSNGLEFYVLKVQNN